MSNGSSVNGNGNGIKTIKENIQACMEIYYHLKTTLGPYGRDKLIVDRNNNYLSTNDGATILQYLKITHPAARLLIGISKSQDETVGDGTTSVVLLTCILLQNTLKFLLLSIHPIIFIKGFQISLDFCLNVINEIKVSPIGDNNNNNNNEELLKKEEIFENEEFLKHLYSVASTSISSKILARYSDHFSKLGVEAVKRLKFNATQDLIRVIGITGNSMLESQLIDGVLLEIDQNQLSGFKINDRQQINKENEKIKSILKNPSIIIGKLQLNKSCSDQFQGLNLSIPNFYDHNNNNNTNNNNNNREQMEKIELLIGFGINIVISDTEIPAWIESIFKENNILYFNIPDSRELEIISHCINCSLIYDLSSLSSKNINNGQQQQQQQHPMISKPNSIDIQSIGDKFFLKISLKGDTSEKSLSLSNGATILLRSPTDTMLQECIRSFKDMLNILSATVRNPYLIGGGGCAYIELSKRLRNKANQSIADEKLLISINCFADSLEMIPMILIQNAGYDSLDLLGKLKSVHKSSNSSDIWKGVNLNDGTIADMISDLNVKEPSFLLSNILTLSSRAAQMILRINNNIFIEPREQFKIPNHQQS
ncbi:hypothetical protein RB653_001216 [Dictyostelium firmibasis]|uniref:TCP-1-eta n=1 Tax=Dictyostelium firmibasis TaxID=79012 RepID=A0AAN7U4P4_9MYCE